jgi:hypothetical protein
MKFSSGAGYKDVMARNAVMPAPSAATVQTDSTSLMFFRQQIV